MMMMKCNDCSKGKVQCQKEKYKKKKKKEEDDDDGDECNGHATTVGRVKV